MPTDFSSDDPQANRLHRMELSIEEINARIARLAIALGVSLQNDAEVTHAMTQLHAPAVLHERRMTTARRTESRAGSGADRRVAYKRVELRGLLVLRYGMEKRYVDQVGVTATRQILVEAEAHLVREGFAPGADGIDLQRLFDER